MPAEPAPAARPVAAARRRRLRADRARQLADLLRGEQLVDRQPGVGTVVVGEKYPHGLDRLQGLAEILHEHGRVTNEVRTVGPVGAPGPVAHRLGLPEQSDVLCIERLRRLDGLPLSLGTTRRPGPPWPGRPTTPTRTSAPARPGRRTRSADPRPLDRVAVGGTWVNPRMRAGRTGKGRTAHSGRRGHSGGTDALWTQDDEEVAPVAGPTIGEAVGAPCWLNLSARDLGTAERFYGSVLGWTFRRGALGDGYVVGERDGVPVAGIAAVAAEMQVPVAWTVFFAVDDADAAVGRIRERGGTVGVGPMAFPPRGRAALATDPEGAAFAVWEGRRVSRWQVGERKAPAWVELHTRNAFDAAVFYGGVLKWADGSPHCCEVSYEDDQVVLRYEGEAVARLNSGPVESASPRPQLRPRWLVRFRVPDLEAAEAAALEHGGALVPGGEWGGVRQPDGGGRRAVVRDPEGALFTLEAED